MKFKLYIVRLLSILQMFLLFAFIMHFEGILSVLSQLVLICGVFLVIDLIISHPKYDFILIVFYLFVLCVGSYSYELMIRGICFIMMVSTFEIGGTIKIDKGTYNFLLLSYFFQAILLIILSNTPIAYSYDFEGENGYFMSLGFSNPNTTGVVLFSVIISFIALYESSFEKTSFSIFRKTPILLFPIIFLLLRALYLTYSRTSLIVCIFTILLFLLFKFRSISKPFSKTTILIITLFPTIYYFVYMYIISKGFFTDYNILNKPLLSGREVVFEEVNALWSNYSFGNIEKLQLANSHNISITLLANIGTVGFVLVIVYYFTRLLYYNRMGRNSIAFLALLALFIHGSNEAVMFTGGSIFYIYVLNLCLLTRCNFTQNNR